MADDLLAERLPPDWSYGVTSDGRVFFISERNRKTTWLHPVTGRPIQTGHKAAPGLSKGWELDYTPEGATYFIDHKNQQTTFGHPVTGRPVSEEDPPPPPSSPPLSPSDKTHLKTGTVKQRSLRAPSAKRNPNSQVMKRGFLYRLESGGISKTWKKRYCVLADFALFVYKSDDEKHTLGSVLLPGYRINPCTTNDPVQKKFAFKVEHENTKTVYFYTDTQTDLNDWVSSLQQAAIMRGSSGFLRETNNNIRVNPSRSGEKSPPYSMSPDGVGNRHPNHDYHFDPQWRSLNQDQHPYSGKGPPHHHDSGLAGQQPWRSVPDLGRENADLRPGLQEGNYDPHASLQSLPQIHSNNRLDFHSGVNRNSQEYTSTKQIHDPQRDSLIRNTAAHASLRSLPNGDREFSSATGFQPYQRPTDPQQRSSLVSDPGVRRSYSGQHHSPRDDTLGEHNQNMLRGNPQDARSSHSRETSRDGSLRDGDRTGWRGSNAGASGYAPQSYEDERQNISANFRHPNQVVHSRENSSESVDKHRRDRSLPESNHNLSSQDPRASYASSGRHSIASQSRVVESEVRGSRHSLPRSFDQQEYGSRNNLSRNPGSPPHLQQQAFQNMGHTYENLPERRVDGLQQQSLKLSTLPPPQRPPYPVAVRDLIVQELADSRSPSTGQLYLIANQLNKERMQQSSYFQYPTLPREQHLSKQDEGYNQQNSDSLRQQFNSGEISSIPSRDPKRMSETHLNDHGEVGDQGSRSQGEAGDRGSRSLGEAGNRGSRSQGEAGDRRSRSQGEAGDRRSRSQGEAGDRGSRSQGETGDRGSRSQGFPGDWDPKLVSAAHLSDQGERGDRGSRSQQGSSGDEADLSRRQDSGSGQFSDSFKFHSHDELQRRNAVREPHHKTWLLTGAGLSEEPSRERFDGDPEAKTLRQAYKKVQSFRQSNEDARPVVNKLPIQTVREEPDMPDDEVLETKLRKNKLNGVRLRMSISAGDLIGKTHDELVLLLIQLRRNQAALEKARDFYREMLTKQRPAEREYRRQRNDSVGRLDRSVEEGHQSFVDIRSQMEEVEKKLEVYRPLINLVDNMVTMGSLYGGDNLMLATQYRKHLLRPDQYQAPRKMLEFSRQHQEERIVASVEEDIRQLTTAEVDLEEKMERLNELDHLLQEQSFKVSSFREDKELLEKALAGIQRQLKECQDSRHEWRRLNQQQLSVEKELSRVTQDLAEASKSLEQITAENNRIEHEIALLKTKVHGELKRSKSAPSLTTENANTKVKMERELARVQNMLQGLSQQGEKLSQAMSTLRRSSSGPQLAEKGEEKNRKMGTYLQTDIDTGEQIDLAQQIPIQLPTSPDSIVSSPVSPSLTSKPLISHQRQDNTLGLNSSTSDADLSRVDWDISDADDNTKRFYGLLPREKPRGLTVRDVKRQSEQRKMKRDPDGEVEKDIQEVALKVSSTDSETSTIIHKRYPSYTSSQSSNLDLSSLDLRGSSAPLYENLPRSGSMPALNQTNSSDSRRSSINLLCPKPFIPYEDRTIKPFKSEQALNAVEAPAVPGRGVSLGGHGGSAFSAAKPHASEMTLSASGDNSSYSGIVNAHPVQVGYPSEPLVPQPAYVKSSILPTYLRSAQPFRPDSAVPNVQNDSANVALSSSKNSTLANSSGQKNHRETSPVPKRWERGTVRARIVMLNANKPQNDQSVMPSSQPKWIEPKIFMSPTIHSSAGDLITNARVDNIPDIVKSSQTQMDKIDLMDHNNFEREILSLPEKVLIPERYDAEADAEELTESERLEREEKAERIKRLLTQQSILSMSQPDLNTIQPTQVHSQVVREKQERAQLLTLNQELARQVTQQSRKAAAERRKTWSGGQFADIKKQYEAEMSNRPDRFDVSVQKNRQANVVL